jgi:F-type H+-transporting ATPase subunit gamma
MANLKEIRTRIVSINSTKQITSAMKMVSAAKLRKAQNAIIELRPFAGKLHEILGRVIGLTSNTENNPYTRTSKNGKALIVIIASNRGLCGAFNTNAVKKAIELIESRYSSLATSKKLQIITIGKKANDILKAKKINITESRHDIFENLNFKTVSELANKIMSDFVSGKFDEVFLVYNEFKNVAVQQLNAEQFLPVKIEAQDDKFEADYIFEPAKEKITEQLIPFALKTQFYKAILESNASEHGARMTAMHKATDNAIELIKEYRLKYNKARQASITGEILEIVGGAEALKG